LSKPPRPYLDFSLDQIKILIAAFKGSKEDYEYAKKSFSGLRKTGYTGIDVSAGLSETVVTKWTAESSPSISEQARLEAIEKIKKASNPKKKETELVGVSDTEKRQRQKRALAKGKRIAENRLERINRTEEQRARISAELKRAYEKKEEALRRGNPIPNYEDEEIGELAEAMGKANKLKEAIQKDLESVSVPKYIPPDRENIFEGLQKVILESRLKAVMLPEFGTTIGNIIVDDPGLVVGIDTSNNKDASPKSKKKQEPKIGKKKGKRLIDF
jgi:hypothetical protein